MTFRRSRRWQSGAGLVIPHWPGRLSNAGLLLRAGSSSPDAVVPAPLAVVSQHSKPAAPSTAETEPIERGLVVARHGHCCPASICLQGPDSSPNLGAAPLVIRS